MNVACSLPEIERRNPEWAPWLGVVAAVVALNQPDSSFDRNEVILDDKPDAPVDDAPLIAGALLPDGSAMSPVLDTLLRAAERSASPAFVGMQALVGAEGLAGRAFRASIAGDETSLAALAGAAGVDASAFVAVATLLPMPWLHAFSRRCSGTMPVGWTQGYCPCCGGWPALAETCGVERNRYLRCGRCGTAWQMPGLACPYCGMNDHEQLGSLLPDKSAGPRAAIETCRACIGYLKAFTTLSPGPAHQVMLDDLATVELDLAATERGYRRPAGLGYALRMAAPGPDAQMPGHPA